MVFTSETVTRGVRIKVRSRYYPEESRPHDRRWMFVYTVKISNEGTETVQLVTRHWIVTDGTGEIKEYKGDGVVGQQPVLSPGQSFEYTSYCPLTTPFGSMQGTYQMLSGSGEQFDAEIAPFALSEPYTVH